MPSIEHLHLIGVIAQCEFCRQLKECARFVDEDTRDVCYACYGIGNDGACERDAA